MTEPTADLAPGTDVTAQPDDDGGVTPGGVPDAAPAPATSDPDAFQDDPTLGGLGGADPQAGGAG